MKRLLAVPFLALLTAAPLIAAAAPAPSTPPRAGTLAATTAVPAGWKFREDRSTSASDPDGAGSIKILTAGAGFHVETPTAAVFWHTNNSATGNYTLKGTFTLNKRSDHVNFYGLVFDGSNLTASNQTYNYFLVAQDNPPGARFGALQPLGSWLVKTRKGEVTSPTFTIAGAAGRSGTIAASVVKIPDASGKSVNTLEVRVQTEKVDFVVNDAVVHSSPRAGITTDGIWGIRSNHLLDITVDGLAVTK